MHGWKYYSFSENNFLCLSFDSFRFLLFSYLFTKINFFHAKLFLTMTVQFGVQIYPTLRTRKMQFTFSVKIHLTVQNNFCSSQTAHFLGYNFFIQSSKN